MRTRWASLSGEGVGGQLAHATPHPAPGHLRQEGEGVEPRRRVTARGRGGAVPAEPLEVLHALVEEGTLLGEAPAVECTHGRIGLAVAPVLEAGLRQDE